VLSGFFHLLALEVFAYPEANRVAVSDYARTVGGWRYLRGGLLFGAVGAGAGSLVGWALGGLFADYGWLALLCPVLASHGRRLGQ
jgi:hypothetical protein